jgi:hypothetical protein
MFAQLILQALSVITELLFLIYIYCLDCQETGNLILKACEFIMNIIKGLCSLV